MSDYTSFAPSSIQQRPWDPVSGIDASRQDLAHSYAQMMSLESMLTANQQRQAELQRYQGMTPNELAESNLKGATANATNPGIIAAGNMGRANSESAKGAFDLATMPGKARSENIHNAGTEFEEAATLFNRHVPLLKVAESQGPLAAQMAYTQFRSSLPEHAREVFPERYSPQVMQNMESVMTNVINNPAHMRDMEKEKLHRKTQLEVGEGNNKATMYAADARARGRNKDLMDQFNGARTPEMTVTLGSMILADDEVSDANKKIVRAGVEKAQRIVAEKVGKGGIDLNNPTDASSLPNAINRRLGDAGGSGITPSVNIEASVKDAGWSYEPNKYEYRLSPDGKVQRRAK